DPDRQRGRLPRPARGRDRPPRPGVQASHHQGRQTDPHEVDRSSQPAPFSFGASQPQPPEPAPARRSSLMRYACTLLALLVLSPVCAWADEEPDIRFFYPIVTRRPVIERELEFGFERTQSREGNTNQVTAAIEWPLTRWWQVEIEVPFVIQNPNDAASTAG